MPRAGHSSAVIGNFQGEVTAEDRAKAVGRLRSLTRVSELRTVLTPGDMEAIEEIVAGTESRTSRRRYQLADSRLPELLVDVRGSELLSLSELRYLLALGCGEQALRRLNDLGPCNAGRSSRTLARAVAERNWHSGKQWARTFVHILKFPGVFAGDPGGGTPPAIEEVTPSSGLERLQDFQQELHAALLAVLRKRAGANRAILNLPTGAGKTRTMVEALFDWRRDRRGSRTILWIAQSTELCEQAVQAFKEVWIDRGHQEGMREPLRIGRLWASRDIPIGECGVIVASIQQLDAWWQNEDDGVQLAELSEGLGVVIVDEAHRAISPNHTRVLKEIGIRLSQRSAIPLVGLTATPTRLSEVERARLRKSFHETVLKPSVLGPDPRAELQRRGILSRVSAEFIDYDASSKDLEDNKRYLQYYEDWEDVHPLMLRDLARDANRNRRLLERLTTLPASWRVLVFACSVQHAQAIAILLRRQGRNAGCVTASTRHATRRALIEQFREGRLSVLCNFGVLTTGFDAPQIRAIVVARPTASPILYEQMIGRGMRGPRFGGTASCLVLDVRDNIRHHGESIVVDYRSLKRMGADPDARANP